MAKTDWDNMPIRGHYKKYTDRVFVYGNLQDDIDLRKLIADSEPAVIWEEELEAVV